MASTSVAAVISSSADSNRQSAMASRIEVGAAHPSPASSSSA